VGTDNREDLRGEYRVGSVRYSHRFLHAWQLQRQFREHLELFFGLLKLRFRVREVMTVRKWKRIDGVLAHAVRYDAMPWNVA
jgi:hypothetical protein